MLYMSPCGGYDIYTNVRLTASLQAHQRLPRPKCQCESTLKPLEPNQAKLKGGAVSQYQVFKKYTSAIDRYFFKYSI